jgi:hypothetical protein
MDLFQYVTFAREWTWLEFQNVFIQLEKLDTRRGALSRKKMSDSLLKQIISALVAGELTTEDLQNVITLHEKELCNEAIKKKNVQEGKRLAREINDELARRSIDRGATGSSDSKEALEVVSAYYTSKGYTVTVNHPRIFIHVPIDKDAMMAGLASVPF